MRHARRLLVTAASAAALGLVATSPVTASCAGPALDVAGAEVRYDPTGASRPVGVLARPDGPLVVTGTTFTDGTCNDTPDTSGCEPPRQAAPPQPARGVELRLTQDGQTWRLAVADADRDSAVRWRVDLPPELRPGRATLTAGTAHLELDVPASVRGPDPVRR